MLRRLNLFTFIFVVCNLLVYLFRGSINPDLFNLLTCLFPVICAFVAVWGLINAFKKFDYHDQSRVVWLLLTLAMFLYFIAEIIYGVFDLVLALNPDELFPTPADFFWFVAYLPLFTSFALMLYYYKRSGFGWGKKQFYWGLLLVFIFIITILTKYLFLPIFSDATLTAFARFLYLFYPLGDLLVLGLALTIIYITFLFGRGSFVLPWKYIAVGFIAITLADIAYSYLDWQGNYGSGNFIDLAWNFGYLLVGLGGAQQTNLMDQLKQS